MAMLFSVMSFASEASIDLSAQGYANAAEVKSVSLDDAVTVAFDKGSNTNTPKYYTTGNAVRVYGGGYFTVTTTTGKLTKIELTFGSGDGTNSITTNVGNYASGVWTGEETSVKFTVGGTSGNRRIQKIKVTYGEVAENFVAAPTISGDIDFIESTTVSIAAGEGLTVYYTIDGTEPTSSSAAYTAAFEVKETTTVKAIAYNGENSSEVTTQTFTKATQVTCAEAKEIALKVSGNNVLTELTYVVKGYVTNIVGDWESGKQSFWIADTKDGGKVFEAYFCFISKAVTLGDYVQLFGKLTKFNTYPEMSNGQATILPAPVAKFNVTVTAENGTVEGAGEYAENAEATLTATANEGYEFTCWTSGEDTVSTANPYTFAVTANVALVANFKKAAPATETVYFINTKKWAAVTAHAWEGNAAGTAWPGLATVKEAEQIAGYDVYSFTAKVGDYAKVIFNNKGGGSQTPDLVWTAGKYYVMDMGWLTKEEAEAKLATSIPDVWTVVGAKGLLGTDWNLNDANNNMTLQADGTYQLVKTDIVLAAGNYDYKAAKDHAWTTSVPQSGNQTLKITTSGTYDVTFVLNVTTKKLTATATLKQEEVIIPTIQVAGDMTSWGDAPVTLVMAADSLTATATIKLDAKTYEFKMIVGGNWQSDAKTVNRDNNSTVFTGANSDTNTKLIADQAGDYIFTWTYATKTLTVTYPALPVKYNVTVTAENGTVTGAGEYEEGKEATLTATAAEGYEFVNWTVADSVVSTEATYTFVVEANVELVANFKEVVKAIEVNVTDATVTSGEWSIDLVGSWNDQALTIKLWQDNTQGFGSYAPNTETGYYILLGAKELTPTTAGVYADNGDGTFTFTCSATEGTTQYNITVTGTSGAQEVYYETFELTNLEVTDNETFLVLSASDMNMGLAVMLGVNMDGTLMDASEILFGEEVLPILSSEPVKVTFNEDLQTDVYTARVVVEHMGGPLGLELIMYAGGATSEPIAVNVIGATAAVDEATDVLKITGDWDGIAFELRINAYDPAQTLYDAPQIAEFETEEVYATSSLVTVIKTGENIDVIGEFISPMGDIYNVYVNAKFAAGSETGVDNIQVENTTVKVVEDGQVFIIRNGVKFNANGAVVK